MVLSTLFSNSKKNKIIAGEPMNVCLRELNYRKVTKVDLTVLRQEHCIDHIPYYLSGLSRANLLKSISDFIPDSHLLHRHDCLACTLKKKSFIKSYTKCRYELGVTEPRMERSYFL